MDLKITIIAIGFAGEKRLDLTACDLGPQVPYGVLSVRHDRLIAFFFAHDNEFGVVIEGGGQLVETAYIVIQLLALAHQLLRFLRVIPK
jgi:hypothetical protein